MCNSAQDPMTIAGTSGVGERDRMEGDEQDDAQEEEEIDTEAAEDAPVKIARDPGDPTPAEASQRDAHTTQIMVPCVCQGQGQRREPQKAKIWRRKLQTTLVL